MSANTVPAGSPVGARQIYNVLFRDVDPPPPFDVEAVIFLRARGDAIRLQY